MVCESNTDPGEEKRGGGAMGGTLSSGGEGGSRHGEGEE